MDGNANGPFYPASCHAEDSGADDGDGVEAWEFDFCTTAADECLSKPCLNGGECADAGITYSCTCVPGFAGYSCQDDMDECLSTPCHNGLCFDSTTPEQDRPCFACSLVGLEQCGTAEGPCVPIGSCSAESLCADVAADSYRCMCEHGWEGIDCGADVDECSSDPCMIGECRDSTVDVAVAVGSFVCVCPAGWAGPTCNENIEECASVPCRNDGECIDAIDMYTCDCVAGFVGTHCEFDVDECSSDPCHNEAPCLDSTNCTNIDDDVCGPVGMVQCGEGHCVPKVEVDSFTCLCTDGFFGNTCLLDFNECASSTTILSGIGWPEGHQ